MVDKKFMIRAWDVANNIMHYEFEYLTIKDRGQIVFQSDLCELDFSKWPPEYEQEWGGFLMMRYIMCDDKNGKLIYDLDIIKVEREEGAFIGLVVCGMGGYAYVVDVEGDLIGERKKSFFFDSENSTAEVIGNIFENRELLPNYSEKYFSQEAK